MKKIGFVTPWFGEKISGGAEMELRGLVQHLSAAGNPVEILTTCVQSFNSNWNVDYHKRGETIECGVLVKRFPVRKRDTEAFDAINYKFMNNLSVSNQEEQVFLAEMINSPMLYQYMKEHKEEYSLFVFIPYMFGTTYYGCAVCSEKSVLIPCLHDESYAYMRHFKERFSNIAGIIFHAKPEMELAKAVYDLSQVKTAVLGEGLYTDIVSDSERFRKKYKIEYPFILYAGRKDKGKNVDTLLQYFQEFKSRNKTNLKLVLIGGGKIDTPVGIKNDVIDLGFIDIQDKYDAYAAAEILCQPSKNESFSLVIMESWLCKTPVLVHDDCAVTKNFAIETNGGLYFKNYFEFEGAVNYLCNHPDEKAQMAENGRRYVLDNFSWDVIVDRYMKFFGELVKEV